MPNKIAAEAVSLTESHTTELARLEMRVAIAESF